MYPVGEAESIPTAEAGIGGAPVPDVFPPLKLTTGVEMYPEPPELTVTPVKFIPLTVAVAVAPVPAPSDMTTVGVLVKYPPGFVTWMETIEN
jgi:hypothetical protein